MEKATKISTSNLSKRIKVWRRKELEEKYISIIKKVNILVEQYNRNIDNINKYDSDIDKLDKIQKKQKTEVSSLRTQLNFFKLMLDTFPFACMVLILIAILYAFKSIEKDVAIHFANLTFWMFFIIFSSGFLVFHEKSFLKLIKSLPIIGDIIKKVWGN